MSNKELLKDILRKLRQAEGGRLHKNSGEEDITTGYGIYRHAYPNDEVFKYVDQVAASLGINKPSKTWTNEEIKKVDNMMDDEIELDYSLSFYETYFKGLEFENMFPCLVYPFANIYTNSRKKAIESLQRSCNHYVKISYIAPLFPNWKDIDTDGLIGPATRNAIKEITKVVTATKDNPEVYGNLFLYLFLSDVKSEYIDLAVANPNKYVKFLNGWDNRVNFLLGFGHYETN